MLRKDYNRKYACEQIDREVDHMKNEYPYRYSRQDQLLVDAAEVQILLGNDKAALELLDKCYAGGILIAEWENAVEETLYDC